MRKMTRTEASRAALLPPPAAPPPPRARRACRIARVCLARRACRGAAMRAQRVRCFGTGAPPVGPWRPSCLMCVWVTVDAVALPRARPARAARCVPFCSCRAAAWVRTACALRAARLGLSRSIVTAAPRAPSPAAGASEQTRECHGPAGRASCAGAQQQSPRRIARRARWPRASQGCELAAPRTECPRRQYHHDLKRTTREHSCTRRRVRRVRTRGRAAAKMRAVRKNAEPSRMRPRPFCGAANPTAPRGLEG
jgi:hypothetical protein